MSNFLPIHDLTPFTMLDFPDRISCIVWFAGCNMRCLYCHNPEIVKGKSGKLNIDDVMSFLKDRKGLLDGVVLSGGEATLYKDLIPFARSVRELGYELKLDTNGSRPDILKKLLDEGLLNYVALDYKATARKFKSITGIKDKNSFDKSLILLCNQSRVPIEVRTTVHTDLLDEKDIEEIMLDLRDKGYRGAYYVQNFRAPPKKTLGKLGNQRRTLDCQTLTSATGISMEFRNF